ncbi:GUN4 domain-containing protein [Cylindrospermopsis raciborskii]|uniref:GUN4 domain-containing protein n=1 Tax=Cylindrospermopsis raciborskii TaxID=77022 RepID=UPI003DA4A06F
MYKSMGQNWAISIGINHYDNLQPLKYAKRDAEAMEEWFRTSGFNQVFLFTEDSPRIPTSPPIVTRPTYGTLRRFLNAQFERPLLQSGDNLWFFFAGHGRRHQDKDYLMLNDTDPHDIEHTAISVEYATQRLRRCGADNVILLLDACRNEGRRDGLGFGDKKYQGVITFYSCSANQQAWEIDALQHGTFTHTLLEGLKIQGEGNCATVERLYRHLTSEIPKLNDKYGRQPQHPYLSADPPYKMNYILLPRFANEKDIYPLVIEAQNAELAEHLDLAEKLWERILAVNGTNQKALQGIKRIAVVRANGVPQKSDTRESSPIEGDELRRGDKTTSPTPETLPDVTPNRYTKLETLLKAQNFREADEETARVMLAVANRESEGWLRIEDAENFPCKELRTIDNLWLKYSQGKFGISVQQEIYKTLGGTKPYNYKGDGNEKLWESFADRVGWRDRGWIGREYLSYKDLNFSILAPAGHLPATVFRLSAVMVWWFCFMVLPSCQDM